MGGPSQRSAGTTRLLPFPLAIGRSLLVLSRLGRLHSVEAFLSLGPVGDATEGRDVRATTDDDTVAVAVTGAVGHREYDPVVRFMALLFALWVAASVGARMLLGDACAAHARDAWEACVSGVLHRHGLEELVVPWFVGGIALLSVLLVGFIQWLRSEERSPLTV